MVMNPMVKSLNKTPEQYNQAVGESFCLSYPAEFTMEKTTHMNFFGTFSELVLVLNFLKHFLYPGKN